MHHRAERRSGITRDPPVSYREATRRTCPRCGTADHHEELFHAADGLICAACHLREKNAAREKNTAREGGIDAALNALAGLGAGAGTIVFASITTENVLPDRAIGLFALGLVMAAVAAARAYRFPLELPRARLWRRVATAGAVMAVMATVAMIARC